VARACRQERQKGQGGDDETKSLSKHERSP
jgi:hypothetical protein